MENGFYDRNYFQFGDLVHLMGINAQVPFSSKIKIKIAELLAMVAVTEHFRCTKCWTKDFPCTLSIVTTWQYGHSYPHLEMRKLRLIVCSWSCRGHTQWAWLCIEALWFQAKEIVPWPPERKWLLDENCLQGPRQQAPQSLYWEWASYNLGPSTYYVLRKI